jgi:Tol biopolymer transport system component
MDDLKRGAGNPSWRADGKELFYISQGIQQIAVDITATDKTIQACTPHPLFSIGGILTRPSVSEDGKRFLFATPEGSNIQTPITIVLHWQAGLKSLRK